jgi:hypothetical protein
MTFVCERRSTSPWPRAVLVLAATTTAAACSLVNAFDPVKPAQDAGIPDAAGPDATGSDAGLDGAGSLDSGSTQSGDSAGEGGASEGGFPDKGVIVVSGRVSDDAGNLTGVLTAIAPENGMELPNAREALNVPVVLYDGLRDYWFVIETQGTSLFPTPTDHAVLHTRTLDPVSGTWKTLQSLEVPPPVFGLAAAITNRLVYVGYDNQVDAESGTSFITIDTTDPTAPNIYGATGLSVQPQGLIATRSQTGNGGPVNMLLSVPCASDGGAPDGGGPARDAGDASAAAGGIGGGQCLATQHVTVPTDPDPATLTFTTQLGPFFGRPAFGSYVSGGPADVIAWSVPGGNPSSPGATTINTFSPQNEVPVGSPIPFQTSDGFFQPFAFAECQQQALLIATNEDLAVYSIPLASASGSTARAATTHSGQSIYFEPYTSTVLAPFTQGDGYVLSAFTLGGTPANPTLAPRQSGWMPPADVRPEVIAVRAPLPVSCPP